MKKYDPSRGCDDEFLAAQNDELYTSLLAELKARSSNRWQYDKIDYCWTGKYADLDWHGYQGLHLDFIDDSKVRATVYTGKTVCPDEEHPEDDEIYCEIVCGCGYPGEWSGDDWFLTTEEPIEIATVLNPETLQLDAGATADALYDAAQKALENWDREMKLLDEACEAQYRESNPKEVRP
jgi:hypothetical protein